MKVALAGLEFFMGAVWASNLVGMLFFDFRLSELSQECAAGLVAFFFVQHALSSK